jgi:hypothetical protein
MTGVTTLVQVFTVSGTYTPPPGLISLTVECIGGGGGGGFAETPVAPPYWQVSGGGGGSGGYSRKTLPASLVAGGVIVTIGAGGVPGPSGSAPTATTFGALCVANPGEGGGTNIGGAAGADNNGVGGNGAPPGVGDIAFPGNAGETGIATSYTAVTPGNLFPQAMGGSMWGGTANDGFAGAPGQIGGGTAAPNTGAGGAGGLVNQQSGADVNGGNGASGICIVTAYCWAGATGGGSGCVNVPACPPTGWYGQQWGRGGWDG